MNEAERDQKRAKVENEYRERIRTGERKFPKADVVAARLWGVDLDRLIKEERERNQPMKRGLGLWEGD